MAYLRLPSSRSKRKRVRDDFEAAKELFSHERLVDRELEQGEEVDESQLEQQVDDQFAEDVDAEIDALDNEIDELWALFEENEGDIESQPDSLRQKLAAWAVKRNILHNAVDELLGILREQPCGVGLPKSARTLVGTIRDVPIRK